MALWTKRDTARVVAALAGAVVLALVNDPAIAIDAVDGLLEW